MSAWAFYLIATVLFYGLGQALTKQYLATMSTAMFIWLFLLAKALVNGGAFLALGTVPLWSPQAQGFLILALGSNALSGLAWLCYFKAIEHGKVSLVGSITAAYPVVTVILALMFLGEHLSLHQAIGVALAVGSGILVGLQPEQNPTGGAPDRRWLAYAVVTLFTWGTFSALVKYTFGLAGADTYTFLVWNAVAMIGVMAPFALVAGRGEARPALASVFLGLIPAAFWALGDLTLFRAFETGPASVVTPLSACYPIVTLAYAVPVLKERLSKTQWVAIGMLMVGVFLVSMAS